MSLHATLLDAWQRLGARLKLARCDELGEQLIRRYAEPHRVFHTTAHLADVLKVLREFQAEDRLSLAAWFHDAIYVPGARDNESRSAQLARDSLRACKLSQADTVFVEEAVLATASHVAQRPEFAPLLDADLSILGAPAVQYANYCAAIRREYAALSDEDFGKGRRAFLQGILKRDAIFGTPEGISRFEANARRNLAAELRDYDD